MKGSPFFPPPRCLLAAIAILASTVAVSHAQTGPPTFKLSAKIVSPTNGEFFAAPADIAITTDVQDYGAYPHIFSLYSGTNLIITLIMDGIVGATNGLIIPVQYTWQNVQPGAYTLTAVVSDTAGLTVTSAPVNIQVLKLVPPLPVVTIFATDPIASVCTNFPCFVPPTTAAGYMCGSNTATFLVRRTGDTNSDLTVDYSIGGTASNGVDYVTLPGYVTIPAGRRFALITIVPIKAIHSSVRPFLTVILALAEPPPPLSPENPPPPLPYVIGWPGKAEAIILEECGLPMPVTGILPDATFNVCLPGSNGMNFCMEVSTDLFHWTPICTNTVVKGCIPFVDPEAGSYGTRYYRAVTVGSPAAY